MKGFDDLNAYLHKVEGSEIFTRRLFLHQRQVGIEYGFYRCYGFFFLLVTTFLLFFRAFVRKADDAYM